MAPPIFAAVDLGASGGRVIAGCADGGAVNLDTIHRFTNQARELDGHLRWDLQFLFDEVQVGLDQLPDVASIGIDTWGVDYGLLDDGGKVLADPISHRDGRTREVIEEVHAEVPPSELYAATGLQHLPFNTIYQLAAERHAPLWDRAAHAVLIPDLLAHHLTGELRTEVTNASTTGLLDVHSRQWSTALLDRLHIPHDLFPTLEAPGELRGRTASGIPVITVGSHDTASAIVGVPATIEHFAYVACGTWSLVGLELFQPVVTEAARAANFTNEAGVDGRTRFLRNVGGLWLVQECLREWRRSDLETLLAEAAALSVGGPLIDVDDPGFIAPGGMPERVADAAGRPQMSPAETTRCIIDSLASAYASTVHSAAELAGTTVDVVHIVGGGSQNELLCQLTADAAQVPVIAGPVEATAVGNVVVQARAHGAVAASLEAIRHDLAAHMSLRRYEPR